jgi:hypothetical protein
MNNYIDIIDKKLLKEIIENGLRVVCYAAPFFTAFYALEGSKFVSRRQKMNLVIV